MQVSGISSSSNPYMYSLWAQVGQGANSSAVSGASSIFGGLQTDSTSQTQGVSQQGAQTNLISDFESLAAALQSGDLSSAQTAFNALETDIQNAQGTGPSQGGQQVQGHHHHHHHHGGPHTDSGVQASNAIAAYSSAGNNNTTGSTTASSGTAVNTQV
ncbi:MAG: hypothetical protein ABSE25_05775 [Syntrophorhabdales bacterium]